ncbi:MAG: HlyD family efflux transporter periplasmic adaptor subunit [Acidobacteriota bacterium]|nr:HlyD family efflux transporter periplasmic adaptor subunit [Acidobacteriota bacterium]
MSSASTAATGCSSKTGRSRPRSPSFRKTAGRKPGPSSRHARARWRAWWPNSNSSRSRRPSPARSPGSTGAWATWWPPGPPLLELESTTPCKIVVTVAADDLAFLAVGSRARILHGGSTIEAKISRIHPAARGGAGTVEVSLPTPPFDLPTGSAVTVLLETACLADALVVPLDAVVEGPTTARLHVLDHGVVRLVPVRVLAATEHRAAVAGDIRAGDVVVRGSESLLLRLTDGAKVSVHNPPVAGKVKTHG